MTPLLLSCPMKTILRIAVDSPLRQSFDYLPPADFRAELAKPGMRVKVPWRNKTTVGMLLEITNSSTVPSHKLKQAEAILDHSPILPPSLMKLASWAADYYQHPIGEVLLGCLPALLKTSRALPDLAMQPQNELVQNKALNLNTYQQQAINDFNNAAGFQTFLLEGVTGSGKTEVYLQIIAKKIQANQQALILVPEIGLTPQTVARFAERFAVPIAVLHSGLNERERLQAWQQAKNGQAAIIIGTRSAIFAPLLNPGVIIIDEEHDLSFKQQSGFRYSARDLAIIRGQFENIPVILGSATPSLESLANVKRKRYQHLILPIRAGTAEQPTFRVIDIRNQYLEENLSPQLLQAISQHLAQKNQVLLFLNRRGFAPVIICHSCGWVAKCKRCDARLTLHQQPKRLMCHHCDAQQVIPIQCEHCQNKQIIALGVGTERLEKALTKHFPETAIIRIDRDSTRRKGSMQKMLQDIHTGNSQILIGTQMLTKGHHFPAVTLVGIIDADHYLFSQDFRASERLGQLLIQVSGRAGRAEKPGEVLIQTHHPDHPALQALIHKGYSFFAETLLKERHTTQLPPFSHMALLRAEAVISEAPLQFLQEAAKHIRKIFDAEKIFLLGPMPAPMEKKAGRYRAQLFIQIEKRKLLQQLLKELLDHLDKQKTNRKVRWSIDVDPLEIF